MIAKSAPLERVPLNSLPDQPLVSILIPSFNQGRFIRATIDSILQQDYRPLKIHVIDGGSKDETVEVLKSYGDIPELSWISEPDKGVVDAVNKGFDLLLGEICGIQSSDDMYLPGAINRIVDQFKQSSTTGLIYGDTIKVDAQGNQLLKYRIGPWSLENLFLARTWIPQPSAFFRREMLQACGGWNETIPYAPDTDLWIRMAYRTDVQKIDEYLSQRRMHDAQRDTQGAKIIRDYSLMIDRSSDIASSSLELRQAAQAGKYLMKIRYNTNGSDWANSWNRFQAGRLSPQLSSPTGVIRDLFLPTRRLLSSIRQKVFGQNTIGSDSLKRT